MANCEVCPVTKSDGFCDKKPYNPATCFKKVNKVREPEMEWVKFLRDVYNADQGSGRNVDELFEKGTLATKISVEQIENGEWGDNPEILGIKKERMLKGDEMDGYTVFLKGGGNTFIPLSALKKKSD